MPLDVFENEILMYLRRSNQLKGEISIDEPLNQDGDGNELLLSRYIRNRSRCYFENAIEDEVDKNSAPCIQLKN